MSLDDLASKGSGEISYASMRDTLWVIDDEVKFWTVRAISAKIIDCKMDQIIEDSFGGSDSKKRSPTLLHVHLVFARTLRSYLTTCLLIFLWISIDHHVKKRAICLCIICP